MTAKMKRRDFIALPRQPRGRPRRVGQRERVRGLKRCYDLMVMGARLMK